MLLARGSGRLAGHSSRRLNVPVGACLVRHTLDHNNSSGPNRQQCLPPRQQQSRCLSSTRVARYKKVFEGSEAATMDIKDGASVVVGGFGLCGVPENLLRAVQKKGVKDLTLVSCTMGTADWGVGILLRTNQIKKVIAAYVGENKVFEQQYMKGQLEVELNAMGTLVERLRASGHGIPAFYTPTGYGTLVQTGGFPHKLNPDGTPYQLSRGREVREFNGKAYVMEEALSTDFALVKAWKGDTKGNLVFRATASNFNPDAAKAAKVCIAEVEELVEAGQLNPNEIDLPGIYVHRILKGEMYEKRIERLKCRSKHTPDKPKDQAQELRELIARRAAKEFKDGMYVNLGIGIPSISCNYVSPNVQLELQSENGLLGMGPHPEEGKEDADLVNASKETITGLPGCSFFSSSDSFGMIRGGKVHLTMLGGLQVDQHGNLANWIIPGHMIKGMGGAMDLVASGKNRVVVTMEHTAKNGKHKILPKCTLPLTGARVVDRIITEMAVFDVDKTAGELVLVEVRDGLSLDDVKNATSARFRVSEKGLQKYDDSDPHSQP